MAIDDLSFSWEPGLPVLLVRSLRVERGERIFLRGASGSGKSTLLGLIGGVLGPDEGSVRVLGRPLESLRHGQRDVLRADHIGFVFQLFNLLPYLSVLDNVTLPCRFSRVRAARARERSGDVGAEARRLLDTLGMGGDLEARQVTRLSIGQQQRVAAARALIGSPEILIADEPTSALDADARGAFIDLLVGECEARGTTVLFVSHDPALAARFDRRVEMDQLNEAPRHHD